MQSIQIDLFNHDKNNPLGTSEEVDGKVICTITNPKFYNKFYNTIHLAGKELVEAKEQTGIQDSRVLEIFRKGGKLTPVDAWEAYCRDFPAPPLTSIRRSITVLTGQGKLQKLPEMKMGKFGKPNYLWQAL